jgi:hypothetical protein
MAELSLWVLGLFASMVAAVTYQLSSFRLRRTQNPLMSVLAGVASAVVFFAILLMVKHGLRFAVAICFAFATVVLISLCWPMLGTKVALTNGSSDRRVHLR